MKIKAASTDFTGRFREIISDPLNIFIERCEKAGFIDDTHIYLHNGLKVPASGPNAYYGNFTHILAFNRGVHEPLEEFAFQEVLKIVGANPVMLELGAYWGHYSMWLKHARPFADVHLVEPEATHLRAGYENFRLNGFDGRFTQAFVGGGEDFSVDAYLREMSLQKIDILHADIQGYELEMFDGCIESLKYCRMDFIFVSTHSQQLHTECISLLSAANYRVEIEADFENDTTSYDGFIFASSPNVSKVFEGFQPLSRVEIACASPEILYRYIAKVAEFVSKRATQTT